MRRVASHAARSFLEQSSDLPEICRTKGSDFL